MGIEFSFKEKLKTSITDLKNELIKLEKKYWRG